MKDKRGIVKVSSAIMRDIDIMKVLYSEFFPFRIDYEYMGENIGVFNLYGICEKFDSIKEGEALPQYDFNMKRNNDGNIEIVSIDKL